MCIKRDSFKAQTTTISCIKVFQFCLGIIATVQFYSQNWNYFVIDKFSPFFPTNWTNLKENGAFPLVSWTFELVAFARYVWSSKQNVKKSKTTFAKFLNANNSCAWKQSQTCVSSVLSSFWHTRWNVRMHTKVRGKKNQNTREGLRDRKWRRNSEGSWSSVNGSISVTRLVLPSPQFGHTSPPITSQSTQRAYPKFVVRNGSTKFSYNPTELMDYFCNKFIWSHFYSINCYLVLIRKS